MSSPFKTSQEFLEVKGPLYTFANSPVWLAVFLILSVLIFLWFIYASYQTKRDETNTPTPNPTVISLLIITSVLSLAESIYLNTSKVNQTARNPVVRVTKAHGWLPALLGITVGATRRRYRPKHRRSKKSGKQLFK